MPSADFTFLTLRKVTPFQPNGQVVQNNYVFTVSSGRELWTNNLNLNNITASTISVSTINGIPIGPTGTGSNYWTKIGPTGFSTNDISIAANTGPTGAVQAGTGAIYSIYNGLTGADAINGDVGVTNNLLIAGATTYPDGSVAISNTPSLLYSNQPNQLIFKPSSQTELNVNWKFVTMSASGEYQSAVVFGGSIWYSNNYGVTWTVSTALSSRWISVAMSSSGQYQTAVASSSGSNGYIWYSTNYGINWTQTTSALAVWNGVAMSSSGQYITALVYTGNIYTANIPIPATSYLTNTNLVIGNVRQNTAATQSIVLNASLTTLTGFSGSACYIKPIRNANTQSTIYYNPTSSEITYGAKTFVIEHPLNPTKYLVHACLEGPEAGVYYRGTSEIKGTEQIIELPEYVSFATEFTVNVTPIYNGKIRNLNCSKIENNKFTVYGEAGEFYWTVIGKRLNINVEPDRDSVVVKGDGPYTYLG